MTQHLVLAGGGHAHVEVLRRLATASRTGLQATLVTPQTHAPYSGMLPGLIAGHYSWSECHIDLDGLCSAAGVRMVLGSVAGVDPGKRTLALDDGAQLPFDLLSLNTGSTPDTRSVPGADRFASPVKPMAEFLDRWRLVLEARSVEANRPFSAAVVGAGAGGVEVALALRHHLGRTGDGRVSVCLAGEEFLSGYPASVRGAVRRAMLASKIDLIEGVRATEVTESGVSFSGGQEVDSRFTVWSIGASAPAWVRTSSLATDARGFLAVDECLRSTSDDRVFAAGDVASLSPGVPKAGVYAVRQGPILAGNLLATARGGPLKPYVPQPRFLSLISLGARRAVASWGPFSAQGALIWRLKDHIDRKFMRRYVSESKDVASQDLANP